MSITPPLMRPPAPEKQPASYSLPSSFPPSPIAQRRASLPTRQVESTLTPTRSISMPTPSPSPPSVTHSSSHSTPSRSRRSRPTKSFVRVTPIEIARRVGRTMSRHDGKPANMRVHRSATGEPVLTVPEFSWKHGQRSRGASLCCDGVFDGECDDELFRTVGAPLVESALKGGSSCIVAYGQSGTGKSYTLWRVMIPAVADALFEAGAVVTVGAQQIYFDRVEDIMPQPSQVSSRRGSVTSRESDSTPRRRSLPERAAPSSSEPRVVLCHSAEQMKNILASAGERIRTGRTMLNQSSSRSHTVVHLQVELGGETGNLALVDLAGSERLKKSGSKGVMQQEAIAINSSLHALSQVIEAVGRRKAHIPTRVCNLTQLLDRYVRGGDLLHLLVCVSPLRDHISETIHSLQFAQSAMRVQDVEVVPDEPSPEEMRRGRISVVEGGHMLGDGAYWVLASPTSGPGSFRGAHAHSVEASPPMTPPISGYSTPRWIANMRSGETAPTSVGSGVHDMVTSPLHAQLHMEQLLERFHEEHFTISELERSLESEKARLARYKYRSRRYRAELKLLKQLVGVREPAEAAGSASSGASTPFDTEDSGGDEPPRRERAPMDMHEWWDSFGSEYEAAVEGEALKPPRRLFAVEETWDEGAEEKGGWERREEEAEACVAGAIDQAVALRAEEQRAGRRWLPPSLDGRLSEELLACIGAAPGRSEKSASDGGEADESSEESWMASSEASSEASSAVLMAERPGALVHPSPREGGARVGWGGVLSGEGGGGAQAGQDGGAAAPPEGGDACAEGSALWLSDGAAVPPGGAHTPRELGEMEIGSGAPPQRTPTDGSAALSDCSDRSQPHSEERAEHALAAVDGGGVEAQAHTERFEAEAAALPAEPMVSKAQSAEADSLSRRDTPTGPSCDGAEACAPLDEGSGGRRAAEEWCVVQEGGRDEAGLPSVGEECHVVSAGAAASPAEEHHSAFACLSSDGEECQLALRDATAEERSAADAPLSSNSEECQAAASDAEATPADNQSAYDACLSSESEEECQVAVSDAVAIAADEHTADDSCPSSDSEECQVAAVATPAEELYDDACLSSDNEEKCQVAAVVTPAEKPSAYDVCLSANCDEGRHVALADDVAFTVEGSNDALACLPSDSEECQVGLTVAVATSVEGDDASYACLPASKEEWHVATVAAPAEKHNTDNACPSSDSGECQAVVSDAVTTPAEAPNASYTCPSASNEEWHVPAVATHLEKQTADDACASSDSGERQATGIDAVTTPCEAPTASYTCLASDCEECQAAPEEEQYAYDACPSSDGEECQVAVSDAVAAPVEERKSYDACPASDSGECQAAVSGAVATPEEEHSAYDACLSSDSEECQAAVSGSEAIPEEDNGSYDVLHTTPEQAGRGSSMARHAVEEWSSEEKLSLDEASPSSGRDACQPAATVDDPTPAVEQEAIDAAYITPERAGGTIAAVLPVTPPVLPTQAALSMSPSDWHARGEKHTSADATEPSDAASPSRAQDPSGGAREEDGMAQCEKLASARRPTLSLLLWLGFIALSLLLTHAFVHSRAEPSDFSSPGRAAEGEGEAPRWASYPECSEGDSCELRQEHLTLGRREQSFHGPSTPPRKGSADTHETFRFAAIHTNMLADNDRLVGVAMPKGDRAGATASDDEEVLPALSVRTVELVSMWEGETRLTRMVGDGTREDRSSPRRNAAGSEWHTHVALPCGEHLFRYRVTTCKPGLLWLLPDCSTKEYHDPAEPTRMVDDKAAPQDTPPYSWRTFWRLLQDALFSFKLRKQSSFEGTWNVRLVDCHDRAF